MKQLDEKLLKALARAAEWLLNRYNVLELAKTAWAFAAVKHSDEKLWVALPTAIE